MCCDANCFSFSSEGKKVVITNQTPSDVHVKITNMFRSFDRQLIKRGKDAEFPFHPQNFLLFEEYFWLKIWYGDLYAKFIGYGGKRGKQSYSYKVRKDGIYGKVLGSAEHSQLIKTWENSSSKSGTNKALSSKSKPESGISSKQLQVGT